MGQQVAFSPRKHGEEIVGDVCLLNCLFLKKQLAQYKKILASSSLQVRRSALKSAVGNELVTLSRISRGS